MSETEFKINQYQRNGGLGPQFSQYFEIEVSKTQAETYQAVNTCVAFATKKDNNNENKYPTQHWMLVEFS